MRLRPGVPFPLLLVLVLAVAFGASATAAPAKGGAPPLLDRELFFGDPEISAAQISPDGKFISFIKPLDGTRNIWVKKTAEPFEKARPLTDDTKRPIPAYFWSRDSRFVLFVQDQGGDENFNVYAVDPAGKPATGRKVPAARNLTDAKGARAIIFAVPKTEPDAIYVGLNDRDKAWHDLYRVSIATGERKLLRQNNDRIAGWVFDNKGVLRLATRSAENGDTEVMRVDAGALVKVYSCNVFESCGPVRFHADNKRVYMETNRGDDVDLSRLILFDPASGKEELVEADPQRRVDFGGPIFSEVTDELVGTSYEDDKVRIYWRDETWKADYGFLEQKLPNRDIQPASATADEQLWMISAAADTEPGERYLYDRKKKRLTLLYRNFEKIDRAHLAPMEAIRYPSSDGVSVPAYLTLPKGVEAKNLPLIVFPHGGPWARDSWGYQRYPQFLANRGYAVLQPNFRASTGYGKKFLNAGNNEWGQKMQDDLTWGVKYLVGKGLVDPKRVGIMGGSYGGYATLAGLAFTPDVYAAGVSIVGPSNLITLLESIPPYWEAIRKVFHVRMGDPKTAEGKAQLERQSPLHSAERIKAPLLVVQGANDPRVNKAESDQIVVALRERGFPVEYLVAPDEGHGFQRPVNNMAMLASAEKFLSKHLGGRFQEGATPEVAQRLKEITVDVKTVTLAKKVDAAAAAVPKPEVDLAPHVSTYKAAYVGGGQNIAMDLTREIKDEGGRWVVIENAKTPMGDVEDRTTLEKGTLVPLGRSLKQGPVVIEVAFKDGRATGKMAMGGEPRPIDVDLGGTLFADGPGALEVLGHLPLTEGYTAVFRNFDMQRQKGVLKQVKVLGTEKITIAAGTFDARKIEVTSADGEPGTATAWINPADRRVLKVMATLPQMGGAVLTSELQP